VVLEPVRQLGLARRAVLDGHRLTPPRGRRWRRRCGAGPGR
jgi:hypothetical protein